MIAGETGRPATGRRAYVFYATDDLYAVAVLVFARLLRTLGVADGTDMVVLHLPLSQYLLDALRSMPIVTRQVPAPPLVGDRRCRDCLVKLRVFGLMEYDRVVYADADAIPLKPLDYLLDLPFAEPLAAPAAYWMPQPFWGSHLLFTEFDPGTWGPDGATPLVTASARHFRAFLPAADLIRAASGARPRRITELGAHCRTLGPDGDDVLLLPDAHPLGSGAGRASG